jgi:pimeloyl-ACP methyl ester carboxylesterase
MIPRPIFVAALAAAGVLACVKFVPSVAHVAPGVLAVNTAPGATIEVLDWGGTGPALVFLAGGGHTAHEFDEFAPRLTDTFRVIGITRRGIGGSAAARHRVARDVITDIAKVLDALELQSAVLVGHSAGGLEAAHFAMAYPDRCRAIVHLDSGYLGDNVAVTEALRSTPPPKSPERTRADSASTAAMRAWIERTQGFQLPESEIRAVNQIDAAGRIVGRGPRETGAKYNWYGKLPTYRWEAVKCPSLGLYAVTAPLQTWLPWYADRYDSLRVEERENAARYVEVFAAWTAEQRKEFGRFPQNRVVEFHATGHYFFLEHPEQERALAAIRDFVSRLE